jgi:hypothetical protein
MLYLLKKEFILLLGILLLMLLVSSSPLPGSVAADPNAVTTVIPDSNTTDSNAPAAVQQVTPAKEVLPVSQVIAQEANSPVQESQPEMVPQDEDGQGAAIQSITFRKDMNIRDALKFLAAKYHKNIIPSMKVDGPITVTALYDVTFEEALNAILGNDFSYDQEGNFIRVYAADEYKKVKSDVSRMKYKVFTLYYITALEASKLILPLKSEAGAISTTSPAEKGISGSTGSSSSSSGSSGSSSGSGEDGGGDSTAIHDTIVMWDFPERIA